MGTAVVDRGQYILKMKNFKADKFAAFGHFFERRVAEVALEAEAMRVSHCSIIIDDGLDEKIVEMKFTEYFGETAAYDIELDGDVKGRYLAYRGSDGEINYSVSLSSNISKINDFIKAFKKQTGLPLSSNMIERISD